MYTEKVNADCEVGSITTKAPATTKPEEQLHSDLDMETKLKRLQDAGITVVSTFENGFYVGKTTLEGKRYDAAVAWVEALAASFPLEGNRVALASLAIAMKLQNKWGQADWNLLLSRWKANATTTSFPRDLFESIDKKSWVYCTTYTCGVWTLFHTLSVSDIKTASPLAPVKPSEIMGAIRSFVKYFFNCEECQRHFMMANPERKLEKLADSDADGPRAVAVWVWKLHNLVNKALKYQQWPAADNCPKCYENDGSPLSLDPTRLREDEILVYLSSVFGHKDSGLFYLEATSNGVFAAGLSLMQRFSLIAAVITTTSIFLFVVSHMKTLKSEKID